MKKSNFLIALASLMMAFVVIGSGCLSAADPTSGTEKLAGINHIQIHSDKENVVAQIEVIIQGTHAQKVNTENIDVQTDGSKINIKIPVVESGPVNTRDIGYETVTVVLGTKDRFKDGQRYTVVVNEKENGINSLEFEFGKDYVNEKESGINSLGFEFGKDYVNGNGINSLEFEFIDGVMHFYTPAPITQIIVTTDGKDIVIDTIVAIGGGANSIDTNNITTSGKFDDKNNYGINIPLKTREGLSTMEMKWGNERFVIGQTDKLTDGDYQITVNGQTVSFTLENGKVTQNI